MISLLCHLLTNYGKGKNVSCLGRAHSPGLGVPGLGFVSSLLHSTTVSPAAKTKAYF